MKILCILQNQWFKDPERVKKMLEGRDETFRRAFIKRALFHSCRTGKVLQQVFGDAWIDQMTFEEASREIGDHSASKFKHDPGHILKVVREVAPDLILAFGKVAEDAVSAVMWGCKSPTRIYGPHPTARGDDTIFRLQAMRKRLEAIATANSPPP